MSQDNSDRDNDGTYRERVEELLKAANDAKVQEFRER